MQKNTTKILEELSGFADFQAFYEENADYMIKDTLSDMLTRLLEEKGLKKAAVIKAAEMSEVYAYQIFSGLRVPERNKLLRLAIGMRLNIEETQALLKAAGYSPLYVKIPFDSVILYALCKGLSIVEINDLLFENHLEMLG